MGKFVFKGTPHGWSFVIFDLFLVCVQTSLQGYYIEVLVCAENLFFLSKIPSQLWDVESCDMMQTSARDCCSNATQTHDANMKCPWYDVCNVLNITYWKRIGLGFYISDIGGYFGDTRKYQASISDAYILVTKVNLM